MKKIKKWFWHFALFVVFALKVSCIDVEASGEMAIGADIGWLSQLEKQGATWVNDNGIETDVLDLLKERGVNAARIRAFVNPPSDFVWTKPSGYDLILGYADTKGVLYTQITGYPCCNSVHGHSRYFPNGKNIFRGILPVKFFFSQGFNYAVKIQEADVVNKGPCF